MKWLICSVDRSSACFGLINLVDASRSDKAGKMLADVLLKGLQGSRFFFPECTVISSVNFLSLWS
jgi:hypothetical protein